MLKQREDKMLTSFFGKTNSFGIIPNAVAQVSSLRHQNSFADAVLLVFLHPFRRFEIDSLIYW